ncbi:hypothetical protein, partial [Actinoplanes sp. DH11]|uniref:hypothetical protein n=1 Tax=Actinoplanes sp. DH11 TaxID=2857011 RepID=UPI001E5A7511
GRDEPDSLVKALAVAGPDWAKVFPGARRIELPTYAFQHQRYWPPAPTALTGTADPVDDAFWHAVDRDDPAEFGLSGDDSMADALPRLAQWRRQKQTRSVLDSWRYRVVWRRRTGTPVAATGTWLLVVPAGHAEDALVDAVTAALPGSSVLVVEDPDRAALTEQITERITVGGPVDGVVSLLALDETPMPAAPAVPTGLFTTLTLVQSLGDAGQTAPLWCLTAGDGPAQAAVWGLGQVAGLEFPERWGGLVDVGVDGVGVAGVLGGVL